MINESQHIISKLNWKTYLSTKEVAAELQDKISKWTKFNFDRTLLPVFNRICPPDHTFRIPNLELDLGEIDFNDLEQCLEKLIPQKIEQQLLEYLLHPNQHQVEFTSHSDLQIDTVEYILVNGVIPWWFDLKESFSLNELVKIQLEGNKQRFIQLLFRVAKLEQVRKRLAWQLKEETLENIIHAVEPTYGNQILLIKKEIESVQMKKNLVKTSQKDLQQGIWLWILNYLFVDRGSFFNQVEFGKSILFQMAQHFNLNLSSLILHLQLVLKSLDGTRQSALLKIVLTIKQSKNFTANQTKNQSNFNYLDHFKTDYLAFTGSRINQEKLSELLFILIRRHSEGVWDLFLKMKESEAQAFLERLDLKNQVLLNRLCLKGLPEFKVNYLNSLLNLRELQGKKLNSKESFFLLLRFKSEKSNKAVLKKFLGFQDKSHFEVNENLLQLLNTEVKSGYAIDIDLFQDLNQLLLEVQLNNSKPSYSLRAKELILQCLNKIKASKSMDQNAADQLLSRLKIIMQENPNAFVKLLKGWKNREELALFIPFLLREETVYLLIQADGNLKKLSTIFQAQQEAYSPIDSKFYSRDYWMIKILNAQFLNPQYSLSKTIYTLIKVLIKPNQPTFHQYLRSLIIKCKAWGGLHFNNESIQLLNQLDNASKLNKKFHEINSIALNDSNQLLDFYYSVHLEYPVYPELNDQKKNVFFKLEDSSTIKLIFNQYSKIANSQATGLNQSELRDIFLKTLLDSRLHGFKRFKLLELLEKALAIYSKRSKKNQSTKKPGIELKAIANQINLINEERLRVSLPEMIEQLAENGPYHLEFGTVYSFIRINKTIESPNFETVGISNLKKEVVFYLKGKSSYDELIQQLVEGMLKRIAKNSVYDPVLIGESLEKSKITIYPKLKNELQKRGIKFLDEKVISTEEFNLLKRLSINQNLIDLIKDYLKVGNTPFYQQLIQISRNNNLMQLSSKCFPHVVASILRKANDRELKEISMVLSPKDWPLLLLSLDYQFERIYKLVDQFIAASLTLKSSRFKVSAINFCLFRMLVKQWKSKRLGQIKVYDCWMEIIHYLGRNYGLKKQVILLEFEPIKHKLPAAFQLSFELLREQTKTRNTLEPSVKEKVNQPAFLELGPKVLTEAIPIQNAGLVLINNYIARLFSILNHVENSRFLSERAQWEASHILQFIVSGELQTEECHLALNKLLCGLHPQEVIPNQIEIIEKHQKTINEMIQSIIGHWPAIGSSSIIGFRGNWLVRSGILRELEDFWELTVEKKPYDLLINKSPFSISIIKLPWMEKALKVNWPY